VDENLSHHSKGSNKNMIHSRTRRMAVLAFTVAVTAICVAACGSSSGTGSSSSASSSAAASAGSGSAGGSAASGSGFDRSKFVSCLKAHGVTLPARPAGAGAGSGGPPSKSSTTGSGTTRRRFFGGGGGFAANPKLRAAIQACGGFRGAGRGRFALNHAAVTKFVACVKQHGYDLPAPNFSGKGPIFPSNIQSNKKFQAASKACASDLRPAGAPGGPGGAPGAGGPPPGGSSTSSD
jgi:hypothetical protein